MNEFQSLNTLNYALHQWTNLYLFLSGNKYLCGANSKTFKQNNKLFNQNLEVVIK